MAFKAWGRLCRKLLCSLQVLSLLCSRLQAHTTLKGSESMGRTNSVTDQWCTVMSLMGFAQLPSEWSTGGPDLLFLPRTRRGPRETIDTKCFVNRSSLLLGILGWGTFYLFHAHWAAVFFGKQLLVYLLFCFALSPRVLPDATVWTTLHTPVYLTFCQVA